MHDVLGWAAAAPGADLAPFTFSRRDPRVDDVVVRLTHCGLCATDLHSLRHGDPAVFPLVAGHEMTGVVVEVGDAVDDVGPGDVVAIGNIVGSCGVCGPCRAGREPHCDRFPTLTYAGPDPISGGTTQGGFSREYVVDRRFTYRVPDGLDPAGVAPLLCAGVTTWAPLRRYGAGPGRRIGVVGVGGLGHLAIRFAHALGAETVAFTSSEAKADAARALGADEVVPSRDAARMAARARSLDLVLDTTGAALDLTPYLATLDVGGTLVLAGIPPEAVRVDPMSLVVGEKSLAGTGSGGVATTREMLAFCGERGITADVETISPDGFGAAFERLARGDVRFRFVVDLGA